jgi:hypothetical protein
VKPMESLVNITSLGKETMDLCLSQDRLAEIVQTEGSKSKSSGNSQHFSHSSFTFHFSRMREKCRTRKPIGQPESVGSGNPCRESAGHWHRSNSHCHPWHPLHRRQREVKAVATLHGHHDRGPRSRTSARLLPRVRLHATLRRSDERCPSHRCKLHWRVVVG